MENQDLLIKINEGLQDKNEELRACVDEVLAELKERPTHEEFDNLQRANANIPNLEEQVATLQSENSELQSQLESLDGLNAESLANLKVLAKQGEIYLDIVRDKAKSAFRTRLMADGVHRTAVEVHPEYLAYAQKIDALEDIEAIDDYCDMDLQSVRQSRRSGRASRELNEYAEKMNGSKTNFSRGTNDLR